MINNKNFQLRKILTNKNETSFLMEAHNGISAKIVEDVGFQAIWASGFAISSSLALRDCNENSWTQTLDILEYMADAVNIPILLDGDTGYGNFNNFRRLIYKLEQRGISGVCIEDKVFPKLNSFVEQKDRLAQVEEFCGKIKAGKDVQKDKNFTIVARVESLVSGLPIEEALMRSEAYFKAGADAILIHSKKETGDEILEFVKKCPVDIPLIIVPTKYYKTPTSLFKKAQIAAIIWANQSFRAAYASMKKTLQEIFHTESLQNTEPHITSMSEIFNILHYDELKVAEEKYLPKIIKES
ncbi:MAG: phosphoenolpyruvate mutase [Proteobacteria bacterium]|nr:phosphoenolpyruvate mutase [Pseudomonadota bacterium]